MWRKPRPTNAPQPSWHARWNDTDLRCIISLTLADFEPVNVSSLIVSNDSGATSH
jgi:hypothetical protein